MTRLQKFLAGAGVASRRKAEALILDGRVTVNRAVVTELGTRVDPARDVVTVDGRLVSTPDERRYYLLYKPAGCVTTASDPQGRPTALEYLHGVGGRVFSVGRLDFDAEGALLLTDDGELSNRLAHPRYGHQRVYLVKVKGDPPAEALERMKAGVRLEDGPARALEVAVHEHADRNVWIRVVVGEGRFHLVKRLCEAVGLQVQRLFRPEFGGISVGGLRPGKFRPLHADELRALRQRVGLEEGTPARAPSASELPRAARRHGHGPPAAPGAAPERPPGPIAPGADEESPDEREVPRGEARRTGRAPWPRSERAPASRSGAGGRSSGGAAWPRRAGEGGRSDRPRGPGGETARRGAGSGARSGGDPTRRGPGARGGGSAPRTGGATPRTGGAGPRAGSTGPRAGKRGGSRRR